MSDVAPCSSQGAHHAKTGGLQSAAVMPEPPQGGNTQLGGSKYAMQTTAKNSKKKQSNGNYEENSCVNSKFGHKNVHIRVQVVIIRIFMLFHDVKCSSDPKKKNPFSE